MDQLICLMLPNLNGDPWKAIVHAVGHLHLPRHIRLQPGGYRPPSGWGLCLALLQGRLVISPYIPNPLDSVANPKLIFLDPDPNSTWRVITDADPTLQVVSYPDPCRI